MSWKPYSARKRLRGLRRHYRLLRQRATAPSQLKPIDWLWLARHQQTFLSVLTDPWPTYQEVPHKPAFRAAWLAHLRLTLAAWQAQLQPKYSSPYLALELYEPTIEFWHSRLVVAVEQQRQLYQERGGSTSSAAQAIALPAEYAAVAGIHDLDWCAYARHWVYTVADYEQAGAAVTARPHEVGVTAQGAPCVLVHAGWMWVGQLAGSAK